MNSRDGFVYVLVIVEDLSNYMWLHPARTCTVNVTATELINWCSAIGPPIMQVSDNGAHCKTRVVRKAAKALNVTHRFGVADSARTNGTIERMVREVVRTAKAILNEHQCPLSRWVVVLPATQWALNTTYRPRQKISSFQLMLGREP